MSRFTWEPGELLLDDVLLMPGAEFSFNPGQPRDDKGRWVFVPGFAQDGQGAVAVLADNQVRPEDLKVRKSTWKGVEETSYRVRTNDGKLSVVITDSVDKVTPETAAQMASALADAFAVKPLPAPRGAAAPPEVAVYVVADLDSGGTLASIQASAAASLIYQIKVSGRTINVRQPSSWHAGTERPDGTAVDPVVTNLTHEYGHLTDFAGTSTGNDVLYSRNRQPRRAPVIASTVSGYAETNHDEFVAEAFTDWTISEGTTGKMAVRDLARDRGWALP